MRDLVAELEAEGYAIVRGFLSPSVCYILATWFGLFAVMQPDHMLMSCKGFSVDRSALRLLLAGSTGASVK
jgi:hypothetical protein